MPSIVAIWNLALSHLGNKAGLSTSSAPYDSREAELCGQFWPIARQFAIVKCKPSWARRREVAAVVDLGDYQPTQWAFTYAKPENALEIVGVYDAEGILDEERKGAVYEANEEAQLIYTNTEDAWVRFLIDQESTGYYHPTFVVGVSYLLAAYIAGPLIKGKAGMEISEALEKKAIAYLALSETHDSNQNERSDVFRDGNHAPTWIQARGYGSVLLPDAPVTRDT